MNKRNFEKLKFQKLDSCRPVCQVFVSAVARYNIEGIC